MYFKSHLKQEPTSSEPYQEHSLLLHTWKCTVLTTTFKQLTTYHQKKQPYWFKLFYSKYYEKLHSEVDFNCCKKYDHKTTVQKIQSEKSETMKKKLQGGWLLIAQLCLLINYIKGPVVWDIETLIS